LSLMTMLIQACETGTTDGRRMNRGCALITTQYSTIHFTLYAEIKD
jgi:hypothetical protein